MNPGSRLLASIGAIVLGAATLYAGLHWGSTVAGGADSYGYVSQAELWRHGTLSTIQPIVRESPWPLAAETWAPLGYRPAATGSDRIVPLYAPGLPLLMALFQSAAGFCAAFVVVPICGAATIGLTYVLGQQLTARPRVSLAAALLVATSPVFLYQLMNPMTDVPVTAALALSTALAAAGWPLAGGLASSVALLIRPNLAAVPLAIAAWLVASRGRSWRFVVGLLPAAVAIAAINARLYGSPLLSGYGTLADLYALSNWTTNLRQFGAWLIETQTSLVLLAVVAFAMRDGLASAQVRRPKLLAAAVLAATLLSYLFYIPFDVWWYLRFLLPMWPILMVAVAAGLDLIVSRMAPSRALPIFAVLAIGLALNGVRVASARFAFGIGRAERRYVDVARFVAGHTDPEAVMLSLQHSGTLRLYADRLTLRFDQLDAAWLDRVVAFLSAGGHHAYFVLEGDEVARFADRFGAMNATGRLDWRPLAVYANPRIAVYDAIDRTSAVEPLAIAATTRAGWRCDEP